MDWPREPIIIVISMRTCVCTWQASYWAPPNCGRLWLPHPICRPPWICCLPQALAWGGEGCWEGGSWADPSDSLVSPVGAPGVCSTCSCPTLQPHDILSTAGTLTHPPLLLHAHVGSGPRPQPHAHTPVHTRFPVHTCRKEPGLPPLPACPLGEGTRPSSSAHAWCAHPAADKDGNGGKAPLPKAITTTTLANPDVFPPSAGSFLTGAFFSDPVTMAGRLPRQKPSCFPSSSCPASDTHPAPRLRPSFAM